MAGRASLVRAEPGFSLPFFDRLAPPPPPGLIAGRIDAHTAAGDVVLDLNGRGGWVARAAVDRQRRAVSLESTPLTRLLAELVLRPPDLRHLDAAFQAMGASPRGQTSLKVAVGELFTTRCATCGRSLTLDEVVWPGPSGVDEPELQAAAGFDAEQDPAPASIAPPGDGRRRATPPAAAGPVEAASPDAPTVDAAAEPRAAEARAARSSADRDRPRARKFYACPVCRGQRGGDQRNAELDEADLSRARAVPEGIAAARARLAERFPVVDGGANLVDGLLDLHTPRQLVGLEAILDRIESDLRAAPVEAALRLGFLHTLLPASRLNGYPGRLGTLRVQAGHVRPPGSGQWRERNPWLAFEDGIRTVRGFIQRLESGPGGAVQARLGHDLQSLDEGSATAVVGVTGPSATRAIGAEASLGRGWEGGPTLRRRIRLVLGQPPVRPNQERLSLTYWATAWTVGSEAASGLPLAALSGPPIRAPWGWQAAALARSLASIEPSLARDGEVVQLVDGGAEALVAAALGGVGAGFRLRSARLGDGDDEAYGIVELVPPGAVLPPGPRTRANVSLHPATGGPGDPDLVPGGGLFSAPERFDRRPFSAADVRHTVVEVAVESLKARGEPASGDRLLGEVLVGLDRAGQLRRLIADRGLPSTGPVNAPDEAPPARAASEPALMDPAIEGEPAAAGNREADVSTSPTNSPRREAWAGSADEHAPSSDRAVAGRAPVPGATEPRRILRPSEPPPDQVESLLALIRDGMAESGQRRLAEVVPGRWWLADPRDRETAAVPLADRVEWAVFSLLSTSGPMSESAFLQRIAGLFSGHDLPDETLVRACLASYRSRASTADRIITGDDLLKRAQDHAELIAALADGGHRLGLSVWIGRREQARRLGSGRLGDRLDERDLRTPLSHINRSVEEIAEVDCAWYVRGRLSFLFEVEWTAMLSEPVLRRHVRIAQDEGMVRFLVIAPERTELVRHKIERSPLLREAFERDNWHVLKWNHLRSFLARDELSLDGLEPYLGLDPVAERSGEQLGLFGE
ncbi:MAG: hypothetical protein H0U52_01900 [Chloroflexi bacterium]|nr:hypothetical protein [Chloroflexota bacterium]